VRWLVLAATALTACYTPNLAPCTVRCVQGDQCPEDMSCGSDHYCHPPGDNEACPPDYFTVAVLDAGSGTGNVSGGGLDCGPICNVAVPTGTMVNLTATPDSGSRFTTWSGACASSTSATCSLVVSADVEVGVGFNLAVPLSVAFVGNGTGGVTSDLPGINCTNDCTALFDLDAIVTLTATPTGTSGFFGWGGDCQGTGTCVLTMTDAMQVSVDFE
jgi:hypothetical protein